MLAAGLVLLGFAAGIYHPSGFSLLSRLVTTGERGRAIGIHGAGGNFGEALAPVFAATVAAQFGWRGAFIAGSLLALACAALALSLPADERVTGPGDAAHHRRHSAATFKETGLAFARTLRDLWASRPLRWLLLAMISSGFVYRGVLTFLPLHLATHGAGSRLTASGLTTLVLLVGIVAQCVGGELADRVSKERLFLIGVLLFAPVPLLLGLTGGMVLGTAALAFGFLWYLTQPVANALTARYAASKDHGLVYGVQFAMTFGLGSFATGLGGLVADGHDTSRAFLAFGVVSAVQVVGALALFIGVRRLPTAAAPSAATIC